MTTCFVSAGQTEFNSSGGCVMLSSWLRYLVKTGPQIEPTLPILSINVEVVG